MIWDLWSGTLSNLRLLPHLGQEQSTRSCSARWREMRCATRLKLANSRLHSTLNYCFSVCVCEKFMKAAINCWEGLTTVSIAALKIHTRLTEAACARKKACMHLQTYACVGGTCTLIGHCLLRQQGWPQLWHPSTHFPLSNPSFL